MGFGLFAKSAAVLLRQCANAIAIAYLARSPIVHIAPEPPVMSPVTVSAREVVTRLSEEMRLLRQYDPQFAERGFVSDEPGWGLCTPTSALNALASLWIDAWAEKNAADLMASLVALGQREYGQNLRKGSDLLTMAYLLRELIKKEFPKKSLGIRYQSKNHLLPIGEETLRGRPQDLKLIAVQLGEMNSHTMLLVDLDSAKKMALVHDPDDKASPTGLRWLNYEDFTDENGTTIALHYGPESHLSPYPISEILHLSP